jgi:hypothetical protein
MLIKFNADYKDFAEINYLAWKKQPISVRLFPYFYYYIISAAISSIPVYVFVKNGLLISIIVFVAVFLINFSFFKIPSRKQFQNDYYKAFGKNVFEIEIELLEDGLKTYQLGNECLFSWQNITSVEEIDDRICFFTNDNNGVAIPKRAFGSLTEQASFVSFGKARINDLTKSKI